MQTFPFTTLRQRYKQYVVYGKFAVIAKFAILDKSFWMKVVGLSSRIKLCIRYSQ